MKAKFTYISDDHLDDDNNWFSYTVNSREECKDVADECTYDFLKQQPNLNYAKIGIVFIERKK